MTATAKNVTVTYAKTVNVEFFNKEKTGTINVQKRTEGDLNVKGIKFILTGTSDSGREIRLEAVTDKDGNATFKNVPIGTYTIMEDGETVPTAYMTATAKNVTVTYAKTVDVEFYNKEKSGTIQIQKRTKDMTNISGIKFILTGTSDSGREIRLEAVTDKDGVAKFDNVPIGTYTITEDGKTVPTGYLTATPQKVTVEYAKTVKTTFTNKEKEQKVTTGSIKIQKRTEGMKNISGIKFILTGKSNDGKDVRMEAVTDKNGVAKFENVPFGTYTITEDGKTVPAGYLTASPQKVTVEYAQTMNVTFTNKEKPDTPPQTGYNEHNPLTFVMLIGIAAIGVMAIATRKKEEE